MALLAVCAGVLTFAAAHAPGVSQRWFYILTGAFTVVHGLSDFDDQLRPLPHPSPKESKDHRWRRDWATMLFIATYAGSALVGPIPGARALAGGAFGLTGWLYAYWPGRVAFWLISAAALAPFAMLGFLGMVSVVHSSPSPSKP